MSLESISEGIHHPNDASHQYKFPLNQSTARCPTLDDVPIYANTCSSLFKFEIKIDFAPVLLNTKKFLE
jgi:hypothetical protein